jgi:predicted ribosomally synthesized peptide with nif11-like leader
MSAENAKKFIDLVSSDPQLQKEVTQHHGNLMQLAAQKGFIVTEEELHVELRARWGIDSIEENTFIQSHTDHSNSAG